MPQTTRSGDEQDLLLSYLNNRDEKTRDLLLQKYDYLPQILARRFVGRGIEYDDIYQCARIGLMNALSRYRPDKGVQFVTYATPTIIGEIKRLFRDKGNVIKVPRKIYEIFSKANKIKNAQLMQSGKQLSAQELAEMIGVSEKQMKDALQWGDNHFVRSLEQVLCCGEDDALFSDYVGTEDEHFLMIENKDFVDAFISTLSEREQKFVKYRYYDGLTQNSIAQKMNISQMNVSRMEKRILNGLKQMYLDVVNS